MLSKQFASLVLGMAFGVVSCGGSEEHSSRTSEVTGGGAGNVNASGGGSGPLQSRTSLGGSNPLASKSTLTEGGTVDIGSGGVHNSVITTTSSGGSLGTRTHLSSNSGGASTTKPPTGGTSAGGTSTTKLPTGGTSAGGTSTTKPPTGGTSTGGTSTGGTSAGSSSMGGTANGGSYNACMAGPHQGRGTTYTTMGSGNIAGGYHYDYWTEGYGTMSMTVYDQDATFKAAWNNVSDFLARVGLKYRTAKPYPQYGIISAEFAEFKTGSSRCFIGVHAWMENPHIECTIIEDWNGPRPAGTSLGTVNIDDGIYDIYHETIHGDPNNIERYLSVRKESRQCGHISVSEHFKQWTNLGAKLGDLVDTKLFIEGLTGSSGSVEFTVGTVTAQ